MKTRPFFTTFLITCTACNKPKPQKSIFFILQKTFYEYIPQYN